MHEPKSSTQAYLVLYSFAEATQHTGQDRQQLQGLLVQQHPNQPEQGIVVAE